MDVTNTHLPTQQIASIIENKTSNWLIENIWLENACGIIGGQPKVCKSWFGLDMAISVASGTDFLGRFPVHSPGPALVFMAEDRIEEVKKRAVNIANSRQISIVDLPLHLITASTVRLDKDDDCAKLDATLKHIKPSILILDPLVRLHRLDENSAHEISGLLGFLRELQRRHQVAIVLTHHASKRKNARLGQSLRGSSDLYAFGDSNVFLSRKGDEIELTVEHRSASSIEPLRIKLYEDQHVYLKCITHSREVESAPIDLDDRIIAALSASGTALRRSILREQLRINNQRLGVALKNLCDSEIIQLSLNGYQLIK